MIGVLAIASVPIIGASICDRDAAKRRLIVQTDPPGPRAGAPRTLRTITCSFSRLNRVGAALLRPGQCQAKAS